MNRPENTAISRPTGSRPLKDALKRGWITPSDRVLDFGCGRGGDVQWLRAQGFHCEGFDPHPGFGWDSSPSGSFDLVAVVYVVNVLDSVEDRVAALQQAWASVRPGGWIFLVARADHEIERLARAKGWPSWSDGYWSNQTRGMFQCGHSVSDLQDLLVPLGPAEVEASGVRAYSAVRARRQNQ